MLGECLGNAWEVLGDWPGNSQGVPRECLQGAWGVPGNAHGVPGCPESACGSWGVAGEYTWGARGVPGSAKGGGGECPSSAQGVPEKCWEGRFGDVLGGSFKVSGCLGVG